MIKSNSQEPAYSSDEVLSGISFRAILSICIKEPVSEVI
jgi:hypothetical protein